MTIALEDRSTDERNTESRRDERNLIRRINRRLPQFHRLHKSRAGAKRDLGDYYVIDHFRNVILDYHIRDLNKYLADLD
jgi:hypothetical protein